MTEDAGVLPLALAHRLSAALAAKREDPQHQFAPRRRRARYAALRPWMGPPASCVQAWRAILAAERMVPMYRAEALGHGQRWTR